MEWLGKMFRSALTLVVVLTLAPGVSWAGKGGGKPKPPPPDPDSTPPAAVTDLLVLGWTTDSVDLQWTATADDGNDPASGWASSYDVRYLADVPIDESNWADALQAQGDAPVHGPAGTVETFTMHALLPDTTYYVAMKVKDEVPNASDLSNVEMFVTDAGNWTIEVAVADGSFSYDNVLAFDGGDNPTIAYYDSSSSGVEFAYRDASGWQTERIDGGFHVDLAYDPVDGSATVAYTKSGSLRFGRRGAGGWTLETIDTESVGGNSVSLAYDGAGNPAISYRAKTKKQGGRYWVRLARWDGAAWQIETVDDVGASISFSSVGFHPVEDWPAIAYSVDLDDDGWPDSLRVARWTGSAWDYDLVESGSRGTGGDCDLAFDPVTGALSVAYRRDNRPDPEEVVYATHLGGGTYDTETVDVGVNCALARDASGTPFVSYFTWTEEIKNGMNSKRVAYRDVTGWIVEEVARGFQSAYTSVAIEPLSGEPAISCVDRDGLRYAVRTNGQ